MLGCGKTGSVLMAVSRQPRSVDSGRISRTIGLLHYPISAAKLNRLITDNLVQNVRISLFMA